MRIRRAQGAQAMVEFAAISFVFFLLFFIVLDGGRALYAYATVAEAAREGAHAAELTESTDAQIRTQINSHSALLGDLGSTATITPTPIRGAMQTVTITVTYQYRTVTPLLSQFGPMTFTSRTVVVVE
jgi:Flp pilus assembly protein TadG